MDADEGLLRKAQHHTRNNGRVRVLVNRYEKACSLASGPNVDRSAYWARKSAHLEVQLRQALDVLSMQPDKTLKPKRRQRPHRRQS